MFGFSAMGGSANISDLVGLQLSGCAGPDKVKENATVCVVLEQDLSVQLTFVEPPSATIAGETPMEM